MNWGGYATDVAAVAIAVAVKNAACSTLVYPRTVSALRETIITAASVCLPCPPLCQRAGVRACSSAADTARVCACK